MSGPAVTRHPGTDHQARADEPAGTGRSPAPRAPAVVVEHVSVAYRRGQPVLDDVSLAVPAGAWLAVIGPNGAGKSTLLKAIAGLVAHDGRVLVDDGAGRGAVARPARARARARLVAYVAQLPVLPPGMTVAEYVLLGRTAHLRWLAMEGDDDRRVVTDVLDRLDLAHFASRPLADLSGGEVQRVVLARALAQDSGILLLDEPTSALDIGHRIAVLELVDELRRDRGLTVVSALHDLGSAARYADQLALVHAGRLVAAGTPDEVLTEATLSLYYQTPVQVLTGADGGAVIVPLRNPMNRVTP